MDIAELTEEERLALAGLVRLMVRIDGTVSSEERATLAEIADRLGADAFWQAIDDADSALPDNNAVARAAGEVTRKPVQELIFDVVSELAVEGTIVKAEADLLDWLARLWGLDRAGGPYRS